MDNEGKKIDQSLVLKEFLIGGVLIGLAGYIAGVLTAPRPGKATRRAWGERLASAPEHFSEVVEQGKDALRDGQKQVADLAHTTKQKGQDILEDIKDNIQEVEHAVMAGLDGSSRGS